LIEANPSSLIRGLINALNVTICPPVKTALYGGSVEEVYAAGKPHPSLQGCINGVFRNRSPIGGRAVTLKYWIRRIGSFFVYAFFVIKKGYKQQDGEP